MRQHFSFHDNRCWKKIHVIGDFGIFFMDPRRADRVSDCKLKVIRDLKEVTMVEVLKVSGKSNPNSVAGALAGVLREKGGAEIQAIGAGALNQAVKAVAIARGFVAPGGIDLVAFRLLRIYLSREKNVPRSN